MKRLVVAMMVHCSKFRCNHPACWVISCVRMRAQGMLHSRGSRSSMCEGSAIASHCFWRPYSTYVQGVRVAKCEAHSDS